MPRNTTETCFLVSSTAPVFSSIVTKRFLSSVSSVLRKGNSHRWPVMTFLSKSGSSLYVINISWAISMQRCLFFSKFSNYGTFFAAASFMPKTSVKIVWHEPNDMPISLATSIILIRRLSKIIFINFIGYWHARATRTNTVTDIFSAFLTPVIQQLNLCSAYIGSAI